MSTGKVKQNPKKTRNSARTTEKVTTREKSQDEGKKKTISALAILRGRRTLISGRGTGGKIGD